MNSCSDFWDALARFHAGIEDTNFDLASVRRLLPEMASPVLVVGAGHGLIVEELRKHGHECDGIDLSPEMIRQAKLRRGITLVHADAKAMPFPAASYQTVIYATGVIDFTGDEGEIRAMLAEGRRVVRPSGRLFVAFYKASAVQEAFLEKIRLVVGNQLLFRESLEIHLLNPVQVVDWLAKRAGLGRLRALLALLRVAMLSSRQEKRNALKMQRVVRQMEDPRAFLSTAPEFLPYRNEREIESLFRRLDIPIEEHRALESCRVVQLQTGPGHSRP